MDSFTKKSKASQTLIPIEEIRNDVVVLKNKSMRMILMGSSLNFALKSGEEQEAIISQYQNFLNSLDFHIQFFIQSRGLNIESYLATLREKEKEQTDELLKIQTKEYIEFVKNFVATTKIVNKTFYIVVPYSPTILESRNNPVFAFIDKIFKKEKNDTLTSQTEFEKHKLQLQQRVDTVTQGLARVGIRTTLLNTEELIELFHDLYNPGEETISPTSEAKQQ